MATGLRVAVLYNLQENAPPPSEGAPLDVLYELDSEKNVKAYVAALTAAGHEVSAYEGNLDLPARLRAWPPDVCFNLCEGYGGDSREAQVPAMLEMLGLRYTGSKVLALALTLDKAMTKRVLAYHGLPTPAFQVFQTPGDALVAGLHFPLFVKPIGEGTGIGIGVGSVVHDERALRERVAYLRGAYRQPVLVERFIDGPDITVGLIGNVPAGAGSLLGTGHEGPARGVNGGLIEALRPLEAGLHVLPITQMLYDHYPEDVERFYSSRLKVDLAGDFRGLCPAPLPARLTAQLAALARAAFWACGCLDFARVDFRLDRAHDLRPYILELNALPGITPISDLTIMAAAQGWSHADLVVAVLNAGLQRHGLPVSPATDPWQRVRPAVAGGPAE